MSMEWQPIETAPKNPEGKFWGPTILIFCTADNLPWPAYWGQACKTNDATEGAWFIADDGDNSELHLNDASHWMPLPARPVSE